VGKIGRKLAVKKQINLNQTMKTQIDLKSALLGIGVVFWPFSLLEQEHPQMKSADTKFQQDRF